MKQDLLRSGLSSALLGASLALCACESRPVIAADTPTATSAKTQAATSAEAQAATSAETRDEALRAELLDAVKSLAGEWTSEGGPAVFSVGSAGSSVRQLMFPGEEFEMTNMYTLDGNGLLMTHYCAAGNQPHMRATAVENGRIAFKPAGVSDLGAGDASYMGAMTLVLVDDDHYEEHWKTVKVDGTEDPDQSMVFAYERVK